MSAYFNKADQEKVRMTLERAERDKITGTIGKFEREKFMLEVRDYDNTYKGLLCEGSILSNTGKKKSGKSRVNSMIVSALLNPLGEYRDLPNKVPLLRWTVPPKFKTGHILQVDSELSKREYEGIALAIARSAGHAFIPSNYHAISLKFQNDPSARAASLFKMIQHYAESNLGLSLVSVDVGTDMVSGINDAEQSAEFWSELSSLAENYQFCGLHVMHMNKRDNMAAGIFGGAMGNKCSMICNVEQTPDDTDNIYYKVEDRRTSEKFKTKILSFNKATGLPYEVFRGQMN